MPTRLPIRLPIRLRRALPTAGLALASFAFACALLEVGYRLLDPLPYVDPAWINEGEHGNLSEYDPLLGWRGVPGASASMTTRNRRVQLAHNAAGFRDVEHEPGAHQAPALVFLGDSFTWGYEVEVPEMFVSRVRERLPAFEVWNLAQRGYGTDQSLLTFETWRAPGELRLVVLMFSENDVAENNARVAYLKYKPLFEVQDGKLVLTGVPVPRVENWDDPPAPGPDAASEPPEPLFHSQLLADLRFRLANDLPPHPGLLQSWAPDDLERTRLILAALARSVAERGGRLAVALIPSKLQIEGFPGYTAYQPAIEALCRELGLATLDLAPALGSPWRRVYYRYGMHWNPLGHEVAAEALLDWLEREELLERP